ncbi:MAG: GNAT family N-acetyltransferase [Bacteroidia bacterium]
MSIQLTWRLKKFEDLSPAELYKILSLREEVFIVEQNCPYLDTDGKDLNSHHLMGFAEKEFLAAYARIVFPGISYDEVSIGRVVSSPRYRRTGLGKILMEEALKRIAEIYGNIPVRIGAQKYLLEFYKGFGFVPEGDDYLEDGIPHVIMLRTVNMKAGK